MPPKTTGLTAEMEALMRPRGRATPARDSRDTGATARQKHAVLRIRPQGGIPAEEADALLREAMDRIWDGLPFSGEMRKKRGLLVMEPEEPATIAAVEHCLGDLAPRLVVEAPDGPLAGSEKTPILANGELGEGDPELTDLDN